MNNEKRNLVRWQDGSYDPYHIPGRKREWIGPYGIKGDLLSDEVVTSKAYWEWMEENAPKDEDGGVIETPFSNPDALAEGQVIERNQERDSVLNSLRLKAFETLTDRQKEVWELCMRQGLTEEEAASELGLTKQAVNQRLMLAKTKFTEFLRNNAGEI